MEFVGIGDLHFDGVMSRYLPNLNDLIIREVRKPLNYAREQGVRNVFFYGDIFHKPSASMSGVVLFLNLLTEYSDLNIHVLAGNHDKEATGGTLADHHSLSVFEALQRNGSLRNTHFYIHEPEVVKIDGTLVNFLPWPHNVLSAKALNVLHLEVEGCKLDNGRTSKGSHLDASDYSCVVGHIHTPQRVGAAHFSGTLYQTNFGESLPKFWHHGSWSNRKLKIRKVQNTPDFQLHNIIVNELSDLDAIPSDPSHLCKVFVHRSVALPVSFLQDHPNVVKHNSFKTETDLQTLITDELRIDGVDVDLDNGVYLRKWLRGKTDVDLNVRKRAYSIYRELT